MYEYVCLKVKERESERGKRERGKRERGGKVCV